MTGRGKRDGIERNRLVVADLSIHRFMRVSLVVERERVRLSTVKMVVLEQRELRVIAMRHKDWIYIPTTFILSHGHFRSH